jgi:hypothetical protein
VQISQPTRHPLARLQTPAPDGASLQLAPQQSEADVHVSPTTRQNGSSRQSSGPLSPASQRPPQQSAAVAHGSPAGRQPGAAATQRFISHAPLQQSVAVMHAPPVGAQVLPPQVPAGMSQATEQHAPARAHGCPSDAQAIALRHTSAPLPAGSSPHEYEQQSEGRAQASPSARQAGVAQSPVTQAPEQQSRSDAQAAPLRVHELAGSGGRAVNSTSRRQPSAQAIPTIRIVHRAGAEII